MKKRIDFIEELKKKNNISKALSTKEMAALCCVSSTTIIKWIDKGKINCIRTIGGHRRIPISELDKILKEMKCMTNGNHIFIPDHKNDSTSVFNKNDSKTNNISINNESKQNKESNDNNSSVKPKTESKYPINKFIKKKTKKY
jgi:excisionase family DNA binding protein